MSDNELNENENTNVNEEDEQEPPLLKSKKTGKGKGNRNQPRTEKQLEQFQNAFKKRQENIEKRKQDKTR